MANINGTNKADSLTGTGSDDKIYGLGGQDTLDGGARRKCGASSLLVERRSF